MANSVVGAGSVIGDQCRIWPNVTIYHGVTLGPRTIIHANCVIGGDGFGFAFNGAGWTKIHQVGGVTHRCRCGNWCWHHSRSWGNRRYHHWQWCDSGQSDPGRAQRCHWRSYRYRRQGRDCWFSQNRFLLHDWWLLAVSLAISKFVTRCKFWPCHWSPARSPGQAPMGLRCRG